MSDKRHFFFIFIYREVTLMKAEIICIGTELLVGDIVNTNSQYISKKLTDIGIDLYYQTTVGDNFDRVKECLEIAFKRADLVITTGGLGPTIDDITKEVVADYFNEELEVVQKYYDEVVERYSNRGFDIAKGAKKEASILKNSELLENEVGLAPGFFYEKENKKIIVLPGPPNEMTWMMDNQAVPLLKKYSDSVLLMKTLEIRGIPEGKVLVGKKWEPGQNPYSITPDGDVVRAFSRRGWVWGATYRRPDYMHFDVPTMSLDYSILEQLLK